MNPSSSRLLLIAVVLMFVVVPAFAQNLKAEKVRASKNMVSEERSTAKASDAAFGGAGKGSRRRTKGSKQ